MKGTHEVFIEIPGGGHAFVTGVPDKCDHNYQDMVYMLGNGDYIRKKDVLCPTDETTDEYVRHIAEQRNTYVSGGTLACCRCGKIYMMSDILREGI